jgi:aspartate racemase
MKYPVTKEVLGVLGGMGALAGAEFVKTLYEVNVGGSEQDSPKVMLYSDPTIPDRTSAFLRGEAHLVHEPLVRALERLQEFNVSRVVICCITIHYLLPCLRPNLKQMVISLLDTIFDDLEKMPRQHLMICSTGTRRLGLFEKHERWVGVKDMVVFPEEDEQAELHRLIYEIKKGDMIPQMEAYIESLLDKYKLDSFIAGCSEIHLLTKQYPRTNGSRAGYSCIDPLRIIAERLGAQKI